MGFRDSFRAARQARKMIKDAQQQGGAGQYPAEGMDLDEIRRMVEDLPQGAVLGMEPSHAGFGQSQGPLEVRLSADAYGPGDTVEGVLVARTDIKARKVQAELRYFDESDEYRESVTHDASGPLHEGDLSAGTELPFALRVPQDALPAWEHAGAAEPLSVGPLTGFQQSALDRGRLYWAAVGEVDVPRRKDIEAIEVLPLRREAELWRGSDAAAGPAEVGGKGKGWDVEIEPRSPSLRRGEGLTVDVTIGTPDEGRESLRVGLVCRVYWDQETQDADGDGYSRRTRYDDVLEQWAAIDPGQPRQAVTFTVPADGPFTYRHDPGGAFGCEWRLLALEERRARRNPRRETTVHVLP